MRRSICAAVIVVCAGSIGHGQRITKSEEFQQAMKTIVAGVNAGTKAVSSNAYAEAKVPLVLARQTLASTAPFWADQKMDGPLKMTKDAVRKLDDLDAALSAKTVDAAVVSAAVKAMNDACTACHAIYREGDSQTGYRIKHTAS